MSKNTPGRKTRAELEKENKYLKAEVEYLKKLDALVQKRKVQQSKKK
jgi:transposase